MSVPVSVLTPGVVVEVLLPYLGDPEDGLAAEWYVYGTVMATGTDSIIVSVTEDDYSGGEDGVISHVTEALLTKVSYVRSATGDTLWDTFAA